MCEIATAKELIKDKKIGFIGGGNMAKAIGMGLLKQEVLKGHSVYVSAPSDGTLDQWKSVCVNTTHDNEDVINHCDIIILAFKPYQLDAVINSIYKTYGSKLFVSILVGVSCETIEKKLENHINGLRLIRTMPNTAAAVGESCTVISRGRSATEEDVKEVKALFSVLGRCEEIPESLMETVAALVGSGPAYIFMVIEALADGVVKHGVPRELACTLAAQTVLGAGKLVLSTKKHPGQLKDEVCSPGGTTICAVHELEKGNLRAIFMNAIEGAVLKARDIRSLSSR